MISTKKQYPMIDIVKWLCSLLVMSAHVNPFANNESLLFKSLYFGLYNYLARITVPFFFSVSAYFLFRNIEAIEEGIPQIKHYLQKMLLLLALWTVILFTGDTFHLWYMRALIVAVVLLTVLLKKGLSLQRIGVIAMICYVIGLFGDSYYGMLDLLRRNKIVDLLLKVFFACISTTRNGPFMGFPFVYLGFLLSRKEPKHKKLMLAGFLLSYLLLGFEVFFLESNGYSQDYNMYLMQIPASYCLLSYCLQVDIPDRPLFRRLRVMSVVTYFSHLLLARLCEEALKAVDLLLGTKINNSILLFAVTFLCTTVFSLCVAILSEKEKWSFLRRLYS